MSYNVVGEFERAVALYCGAPYCVSTNSGTMAIMLAIAYWTRGDIHPFIGCVKRTYASAPMAIINLGGYVEWRDEDWMGAYQFTPLPVWDSARRFTSGMYRAGQFQCVSFQTSKILGLEQGGAILHDNAEADTWLRRARFDGRLNAEEKLPQMIGWHGYLSPSTAALGLQRLACLPRDNPDQAGADDFPDLSQLPCFR